MSSELEIVLVKTRFPENIGMVARACANFGCPKICLVEPEKKDLDNAIPLATKKGQDILKKIRYAQSLSEALASSNLVIGTTARTGGWRKVVFLPDEAAEKMISLSGAKISLVFGPEDRGLSNSEILLCNYLVHIPAKRDASSLNLAQAVLILLYEYAKIKNKKMHIAGKGGEQKESGNTICNEERERMLISFKQMLMEIDFLHGNNPDYFMLQWRDLFSRANLKRHEYDAVMGLCRQIHNKLHP